MWRDPRLHPGEPEDLMHFPTWQVDRKRLAVTARYEVHEQDTRTILFIDHPAQPEEKALYLARTGRGVQEAPEWP